MRVSTPLPRRERAHDAATIANELLTRDALQRETRACVGVAMLIAPWPTLLSQIRFISEQAELTYKLLRLLSTSRALTPRREREPPLPCHERNAGPCIPFESPVPRRPSPIVEFLFSTQCCEKVGPACIAQKGRHRVKLSRSGTACIHLAHVLPKMIC
eukprot:3007286-Pleurochrysis_carterae.AAC.4